MRSARVVSREESGHPAKLQGSCVQCWSKLKVESALLCLPCYRAAAELHKTPAGTIGAPCEYCSAESVGVLYGCTPFCEAHIRDWRSLDFVGKHGFLPHVVMGRGNQGAQ
jgi:hypothetical protein